MTRRIDFPYDVALSFAGPDRRYVEKVANCLRDLFGLQVFFDKYEETNLWGKDLYAHLHDVYSVKARYTVLFVSRHYKKRLWTRHELRSAQERALQERHEYILPARFDDTELPGLFSTTGYIDLKGKSPGIFASLVYRKVGRQPRTAFVPDSPDRLFKAFSLTRAKEKKACVELLQRFVRFAQRLKTRERDVLYSALKDSCPISFKGDAHIALSDLMRETGLSRKAVLACLKSLHVAGLEVRIEADWHQCESGLLMDSSEVVSLTYQQGDRFLPPNAAHMLALAVQMLGIEACSHCTKLLFRRLDFSLLSATPRPLKSLPGMG
jgi:biotin operon repressor